jgi:two-component system, OmpR family, sensor kinase
VSGLVDYTSASAWSGDRARDVSLAEVAGHAVDRAHERWPDARIELDADDSTADVDAELVVRAIGNLVDNALVHGAAPVVVRVEQGLLRVEDHGPGFAIDAGAADPFEPFVSGGGGSGIGLAFVRHVARAHGGDAWIDPVQPSCVVMSLAERPEARP